MVQPKRYRANASANPLLPGSEEAAYVASMAKPPGVRIMAVEIQNAP
jgi:hypothetical protein